MQSTMELVYICKVPIKCLGIYVGLDEIYVMIKTGIVNYVK